jgi:hypothetical protein
MSCCSARFVGSSQSRKSRQHSSPARSFGRKRNHLEKPPGASVPWRLERSVPPLTFRSRPATITSSSVSPSSRSSPLLQLYTVPTPYNRLLRSGRRPTFTRMPPSLPSPEPRRSRDRYRENLRPAAMMAKDAIALLPFLVKAQSEGSPLFLTVLSLPFFRPLSRNGRPRLLRISRPRLTAGSMPVRALPRLTAARRPAIQLLQTCLVRLYLDRPIEVVPRTATSQVRGEPSEGLSSCVFVLLINRCPRMLSFVSTFYHRIVGV